MADENYTVSYGVDIDQTEVSRLEDVLKKDVDFAEKITAAFENASKALQDYRREAGQSSSATPPTVPSSPSDNSSSGQSEAPENKTFKPVSSENGSFDPVEAIRGYAQLQLSGILTDPDAPLTPRNAREYALTNYETRTVGIATRDSANARQQLLNWQDVGLSGNPADLPGFQQLQEAADDFLREPLQKAREYMQQALDAEGEGLDGSEYVDKMREVLEAPLQQVKELFDNFDFGNLGSDGDGTEGLIDQIDDAEKELDGLRTDARTPIEIDGDATAVVSAAYTALEDVKRLFSQTFSLRVIADTTTPTPSPDSNGSDEEEDEGSPSPAAFGSQPESNSGTSALQMSVGGRFTKPTLTQVAEDGGTEYIIPVKKENRALPLLRDLISELSPQARNSLMGSDSMNSASYAGSYGMISRSVTQNNNNQMSAPVTINVNSSGADAERIGQSIYNTAERYLLRTMKGVFA